MVSHPVRVAVVGGDGRFDPATLPACSVRIFKAQRWGGNGSLRRLESALRSGGVDRVLVLARWHSHPVTKGPPALPAAPGAGGGALLTFPRDGLEG